MWSFKACLQAFFKTLIWLNMTMISFHVKSKAKVMCWTVSIYLLDHLCSFSGLGWSVLVLRRRRVYGPGLGQILLQFQLRGILDLAFVKGVLPDKGACLDTRKEHQATQELWKVSLHRGVPSLGWHHLLSRLTFRTYNNPIFKTEFLHIS